MSAADAHGHDEQKHHGWQFYTAIAGILGVLTFVEIGPLFEWYYLPAGLLLALSVVKFFIVVAFFMHLWDDPPVFSQMFVAPLIGGSLMVVVLMVLFHTFRPLAYDDSIAIQERYGDTWNKDCQSWLRSHKSGRLYCASPMLDKSRVAVLGTLPDGDRIAMPTVGGGPTDDPALTAAYKAAISDVDKQKVLTKEGEALYKTNCASCHQANGQGVPGAFPPLAASDYYGTPENHAKIVLNGLNGRIVVNGVEYNGAMQAFGPMLTNLQAAAIITYERNAWGNNDGWISPEGVQAQR